MENHTHHVHFSGIEASNQENDISAHRLIRSPVLAVVETSLNLRLICGCKVMRADVLQSLLDGIHEVGQPACVRTESVVHPGSTGHGVHRQNLLVIIEAQVAHDPEDGCSLGVANVLDSRLTRLINYMIDHGRQIELTDLIPREAPEVLVYRVQSSVSSRIPISTTISHPDIVTFEGVEK